jgi:hypothetical protein
MLATNNSSGLSVGGYGQIDFNQQIDPDAKHLGALDVHRMVLMFGYKFNNSTNFITELELEHVSEIYVEQAFLSHRINQSLYFRGGLMLVPMGIINEYHEPTTYNGVERPNVDKYIVPSTWREIGAGFSGNIMPLSLRYQAYVMNGFMGYNGDEANFSGKNGLRSGRQKGAESSMSSPSLSVKFDHYGIKGLRLGASYYMGNSQSPLYDGLNPGDSLYQIAANGEIGIKMFGLDARYYQNGWQLRAQYINGQFSNTAAYNKQFDADMGSAIEGYYAEVAYDVFRKLGYSTQLLPFVRYEHYNTHHNTDPETIQNKSFERYEVIAGLGWKITPGAVIKGDFQQTWTAADTKNRKNFVNFGVGVWF